MKFEAFIEKQYKEGYGYVWYWWVSGPEKSDQYEGWCDTKRQAKRMIRREAERIKYEQNRISESWGFEL